MTARWQPSLDPAHWREHALRPVRFGAAVERLLDDGYDTFIELGPDGLVTSMARRCLTDTTAAILFPTMLSGRPEAIAPAMAHAFAQGAEGGAAERLGHHVGTEGPLVRFDRREAHAVHRDRVAR